MTVAHGFPRSDSASVAVATAAAGRFDDEALTAFRMAVNRLSRRMRLEATSEELNFTQHNVLAMLCRIGPMTPTELATTERVKPPSMTRAVNALAEAGLVVKIAHPTDGRQVVVELTDRGHDVLAHAREIRTAWLRDHLAELTPDEQATLIAATPLLDRLGSS